MRNVKDIEGLCTKVSYLVLPPLYNNCYLISFELDGQENLLIVDPSSRQQRIIDAVGSRQVKAIFVTHGHYDHFGAAADLRAHFDCPVYASKVDSSFIEQEELALNRHVQACKIDNKLDSEQVLHFGNLNIEIIFTPGHSMGSLCLLVNSSVHGKSFLISGDTLFKAGIGRTDFENSDVNKMAESLHKLSRLEDDIIVLPGHNDFTTIREERNYFLDKK